MKKKLCCVLSEDVTCTVCDQTVCEECLCLDPFHNGSNGNRICNGKILVLVGGLSPKLVEWRGE